MRIFRCLILLLLCLPAVALLALAAEPALAARDADLPVLRAAVAYGHDNLDVATGLIKSTSGVPDLPGSSAGYVAACFATGQDLDQARAVLGKVLDLQQTTGAMQGHFPWSPGPGAVAIPDATWYAGPLLAYVLKHHAAELGPDLAARLKQSLELAQKALSHSSAKVEDDARYLLPAAAQATIAAALGLDAGGGAGAAETWLKVVTHNGLPAGHSPTFDAARYVALKWIRESVPEDRRPSIDRALTLAALDLAGRVHPASGYLAGAITEAFAGEYIRASGFASYVLYSDFGQPQPERVEPYVTAAVLPEWRAPASITALTSATGLRRTRSLNSPVEQTDTYVGPFFSLGTMSGRVNAATIPIFCTFARSARPTLYFYCDPTPCSVNSLQADNLALCSFNFDDVGVPPRVRASLCGVLGTNETVKEVMTYGVPWNGQPTAVGELETVALTSADCYVGITLTRTGSANNVEGAPAKPATLAWSKPDGTGNLVLTIYARQQEYPLPVAQYNMRAGVVVEIASLLSYPTLADFTRHVQSGRLKQFAKTGREYEAVEPKQKDPNVLIPQPQPKGTRAYRVVMAQTLEYMLGDHALKLTEDLVHNQAQDRQIDNVALDTTPLWESEFFKWQGTEDLAAALGPYLQ